MEESQVNQTSVKTTPTAGQPDYSEAFSNKKFDHFFEHIYTHKSVRPDYRSELDDFINNTINKQIPELSLEDLWKILKNINKSLQRESISPLEKEISLKLKQEILVRIEVLTQQKASRNINSLRALAEQSDVAVRDKMLVELNALEENAKQGEAAKQQSTELEIEQRKMQMQLDAEERRVKTRMRYFDRFLERESAATILGAIILIILTLALLAAMYTQDRAREIVYSGFLILLGYFFGQTAGKAAANRNSTDS